MKKIIVNKLFIVISALILILFFAYFNIKKESYALEEKINYMGDYILNPLWVEYMELSTEEKVNFNVIPEKFIVSNGVSEEKKFNFLSLSNDEYPEYYNLKDSGYSTNPRHQYGLGICWAFASIASVESNMLITGMSTIENPIIFSERQLDYLSVHKNYIKEGYNPYAFVGREQPGSGAYPSTAFKLFNTGLGPVTIEVFGIFDEDKSVREMKDIFDSSNVEYVVDGYVNLGSVIESSTQDERDEFVESVKEHVMNYGAVAISTIGPLRSYAGSCIYGKNDNYMLNVNGDCNPPNINNRHAMAIIGWDDNYEYSYCRLSDETIDDLTDCENIVSGKGAFILKNSWGDLYPYPYFSYTSNVDGAYGVTKVSLKNWDVNYDFSKSNISNFEHRSSIVTYDRSTKINEELVKVSFYTNTKKSVTYDIYFKNEDDSDYQLLNSVVIEKIGLNTIDLDGIDLTSDSFSIKIISDDGYVDLINAYTKYLDNNSEKVFDTVIKTGDEYEVNFSEFQLYTSTRNVEVGSLVQYKFSDESGNDISDYVEVKDNVVLNNMVNPKLKINNSFPIGDITIQTIYDDVVFDSDVITVNELDSLWEFGTGTVDDPYLINEVDDFINIFTSEDYMGLNYKLNSDIDFSNVDNWNIGELSNYMSFKGSFDGNGHVISSLNCNSNLCSLFYNLENAKISNIIFTDFNYDVQEYGWGNLIGVNAYDSEFENIVITKSVNISGKGTFMGGIVAGAYNSSIKNVSNYANVDSQYGYENGRTSGIVNEAYGAIIDECYNYGNIKSLNSVSAGIVSYLGNYAQSENVGTVSNSYNLGSVESNSYGGGIVGNGDSTIVNYVYNVFTKLNDNIGNIVGNAYGMVVKNSYYLSDYGSEFNSNDQTTLINVMGRTDEQLKTCDSYTNFDFDNVWFCDLNYPYLKNFNYIYIDDLINNDDITMDLGNVVKLDINYSPADASLKKFKYSLSNNDVISIDDEFNITAVGDGDVILTVYALDGSGFVDSVKISVIVDKIDLSDFEIINDSFVKTGLKLNRDNFVNNITVNELYKISVTGTGNYVGTGNKIEIYKDDVLKDSYTIFVLGDVTGTGVINVSDVAKVYQHIKGVIVMEDEFLLAADVVKDDELRVNDVAKLYQYIKKTINSLEE